MRQYYSLPQQKDALEVWSKSEAEKTNVPYINFTADESEEIASILNNVKTYVDEKTLRYLDSYATELNQNTQQIRRIGTNVSALIRDIRTGMMTETPSEKQQLDERLSYIMFAVNREMEKQGKLADALLDILDGVDINVKMV